MPISGIVRNQTLRIETPLIVSDTIDYLTAKFDFLTSDWEGLDIYAHFRNEESVFDCHVINGEIAEDAHMNLSSGCWEVWLHGILMVGSTPAKRITTSSATIHVQQSGMLNGEPFPSIPGSITEELLAGALHPVEKEDEMTEPVGKDENGKLWVKRVDAVTYQEQEGHTDEEKMQARRNIGAGALDEEDVPELTNLEIEALITSIGGL